MNTLKRNMINIFGEQGKRWIANLPRMVNELAGYWKLHHIVPVDNMTFNYVAKTTTSVNECVKSGAG